jgi:methylphosphotriester-DNA--protein-cysteine methyltransferase
VQRHFLEATGLTAKGLEQIQRACRAVELLAGGRRPVDVAVAQGYSDQSHLTRSLKAIMGQTPRQIARTGHTAEGRGGPDRR